MIVKVIRTRPFKIILAVLLCLAYTHSSSARKNKCEEPTKLADLISQPKKFLNKKILIEGNFYSFSTLSLDYKPAERSSKDYIGLVLSRPDQKEIPLVELKLSASLEEFKKESISIDHGDKVSIKAKVYAVALGEPWLEIEDLEVEKSDG